MTKTETSDIQHVREELTLTAHEVALSLAKRAGKLAVLADVAGDLEAEAQRLRRLSQGKTA